MHSFGVLSAFALLASYVSAAPAFGFGAGNGCHTKHTAHELVRNFIKLTNGDGFNQTLAEALISPDVVDTSGSVASIINGGNTAPVPLLGPTLTNLTQFIGANAAQASTPYTPLNIYWTCDVVIFRFEILFEPQPVLGISILETTYNGPNSEFPFMIQRVYGELNSFAFLVDLGVYEPIPPPTANSTE